ncbi:hypothetical protein GO730_37840 [Spirosoma sp. HMF3257]|uniref:DUF308 domain-containing protein n=1 Tax=Spirosoma telluris TaxID=2183553 RepID=A0A327ND43_9BACT|nr:hypothetical protein [Spirosoma telluris]RAI73137.1 hypothetical protein HMF3257_37750 [Spirosoma telluris]
MAFSTLRSARQSWWLLYLRSALFAGIGILLFFSGSPHPLVLNSLCVQMIIAGWLAIYYRQINQKRATNWFLFAGMLDILAGLALLFYIHNPNQGIVFILGAWGILIGIIQAVEAMYVFIGLQTSGKNRDSSSTLIHFLNVLIYGGIAFILLLQPLGEDSMQFVGWFFIALSIALLFLTLRLQVDEEADMTGKDALVKEE